MNFKAAWTFLKETFSQFSEHRVLRLAAATAYYAIFSIGPLLVLLVGVAGLVFGQEHVRREVHDQMKQFVGAKSADVVGSMMSAQKQGETLLATIIGGVALVLGASGVFGQLQDSLNTIWGVATKPGAGMGALIRDRVFSMATVLGIGFLLLLSMALSIVVNAFSGYIGHQLGMPAWIGKALNEVVSLIVISVLFALIFKILPDVKIRWRHVWIGAVGTAVLFTLGKYLLGIYLSRQEGSSAYGAGSAFVVILLYIYYSSVILYYGAEFTQLYARRAGSGIEPSKYAVKMTDAQRAVQGIPREEQLALHALPEPAKATTGAGHLETRTTRERNKQETDQEQVMSASKRKETRAGKAPLERIQARPWAYVGLALVGGLVTGIVWRIKGLRRAVGTFSAIAAGVAKEGRGGL